MHAVDEERKEPRKNEVVEIVDEVVQIIAGLAASKTEGVAAMSGGAAGGIAERLGRKNLSKGVKVSIDEDSAQIDVYIIAHYGTPIHETFHKVQNNVKEAVEDMTGLTVQTVNVYTQGLANEHETVIEDPEVEN